MTCETDPSLDLYVKAILGKKALYPVILDVRDLSSVADFFVICGGRSNRQVKAIAEHAEIELKKNGVKPLSVEGMKEGHWVLMDYGHVIIHVFYEPVRSFYDLEGLWIDAKRIETESIAGLEETEENDRDESDSDLNGDYDDNYSKTL
jgi:ribosome-associated protein